MLTKIFYEIDDFMKKFELIYKSRLISQDDKKLKENLNIFMIKGYI